MFGAIIRSTSFMTSTRPAPFAMSPLITNLSSILRRGYASKTIYVSNIPWSSNEQMLRELGTKYGEVTSVRLPLDFEGRVRGFGFIEYNDEETAQKALENINGYEYEGRQLRAEEASGPRNYEGNSFGGGRGFRGGGRGRFGRGGGGVGRGFGGNRDNSEWDRRRPYGDD